MNRREVPFILECDCNSRPFPRHVELQFILSVSTADSLFQAWGQNADPIKRFGAEMDWT